MNRAATALAPSGARLSEIDAGRVWWQDEYALDAWVQRQEQQ